MESGDWRLEDGLRMVGQKAFEGLKPKPEGGPSRLLIMPGKQGQGSGGARGGSSGAKSSLFGGRLDGDAFVGCCRPGIAPSRSML